MPKKIKLEYCKHCILPNTRPRIVINKNRICSACNFSYQKDMKINWNTRKNEFLKIINNKRKNNKYDCLIPVSGGKDSTWQVITALKYKLKPLCVTWNTPARNTIGQKNLRNLINLGVDHIDFTINPKIEKKFILKSFEKYGNPLIPMHMAIHSIPINLAIKFKIPLVIWGENSAAEYGGNEKYLENERMNRRWKKLYGVTHGTTAKDWVDKDMKLKDLAPYSWPTDKEVKKNKIQEIFLGYYFKWDPDKIFKISKKFGFTSASKPKTGFYSYADIDDEFLITVHHWMKWYKFGFTRLWDNLTLEIRNKRLTRKKAIQIVSKQGNLIPIKEINKFCKYLNINRNYFLRIAEKFRNKAIWKKENKIWKIKKFLIKDWNWKKDEI
jgi:N-acetyl sugar amidotransferase